MEMNRIKEILHNIVADVTEKTDIPVITCRDANSEGYLLLQINEILSDVLNTVKMPQEQFLSWLQLEVGVEKEEMLFLMNLGIVPVQ